MVTEEENRILEVSLDDIEIREVVFRLIEDNYAEPDGLSGRFFQVCWNIVGVDVIRMVKNFFAGNTLPKSITNTNLALFHS